MVTHWSRSMKSGTVSTVCGLINEICNRPLGLVPFIVSCTFFCPSGSIKRYIFVTLEHMSRLRVMYGVMSMLCTAHKLTAVNARVNFDDQTQSDVDRQYRALADLVNIPLFLL